MLAGIGVALVQSEAAIDLVVQGLEERGLVVGSAGFGQDPSRVQFANHLRRGTGPGIEREDRPHRFRLKTSQPSVVDGPIDIREVLPPDAVVSVEATRSTANLCR